MKLNECTKIAILHEVTGYPSCRINMYPAQHAVTIRWLRRRSKTLFIPADVELEDWVKKYANDNETTPEFFAVDRPRTRVEYRIYERRDDGEVQWNCFYGPEGYSKYYENDLRYNLQDAQAHCQELILKAVGRPEPRLVIVEVTTTIKVVD